MMTKICLLEMYAKFTFQNLRMKPNLNVTPARINNNNKVFSEHYPPAPLDIII